MTFLGPQSLQRSVFDPFPVSTQHFYNNCLRRNTSDPFAITTLLILSTDVGRLLDNQLFCLLEFCVNFFWGKYMDVIINNDYLNSLATWSIKQMIPLPIPHVSLISILTTKFPAHSSKVLMIQKKHHGCINLISLSV